MAKSRLDTAMDKLFGVTVEEFMATRDALVTELRAAGDKDAAAAVKAQHKPTLVAQAANQLARVAETELDDLFETSRALASGKDFKNALEQQRAALEKVRAKMPEQHVSELLGLVRGAMVDAELAERVKAGHFSKLPEVQVGFFGAAPAPGPKLHVLKGGKDDDAPKHAKAKPGHDKAPVESERDKARRAKAEREERERADKEKTERDRVERLAKELEAAEAELSKLSAAADDAERKAGQARRLANAVADKVKRLKARH